MIKINNTILEGNILMAPLAGVTDISFRKILKKMGADLTYTEMVSAKALHYKNEKTKKLISNNEEGKIAIQLFGSDPNILGEIASILDEREDVILIDINMGCPAPKLVKNHEGAYLMTRPDLASSIIKKVKKSTKKPVTCKFRRGFYLGDETALDFAKMAEESGADMVTVHGRYRDQFYSGTSDREIIRRIKEEVKIPVIGNGDIFTGKDAKEMFDITGCDGIMVARGALGNPWIFKEIKAYLNGEDYLGPRDEERIDMAIYHLKEACLGNENIEAKVKEMRKHIGWYLKGLKNSTRIRDLINTKSDLDEVINILEAYKGELIIEGLSQK